MIVGKRVIVTSCYTFLFGTATGLGAVLKLILNIPFGKLIYYLSFNNHALGGKLVMSNFII